MLIIPINFSLIARGVGATLALASYSQTSCNQLCSTVAYSSLGLFPQSTILSSKRMLDCVRELTSVLFL